MLLFRVCLRWRCDQTRRAREDNSLAVHAHLGLAVDDVHEIVPAAPKRKREKKEVPSPSRFSKRVRGGSPELA